MKLFGRFCGGVALLVGAIGAGAGIALIPIAASPAGAATVINVTDASDNAEPASNCTPNEENANCTLRAALAEAATISGAVTVNVPDPSGLTNGAPQYQVLNAYLVVAALNSSSSVSVAGVGAATSVIQAQCTGTSCTVNFGVFEISSGTTATISSVTIEEGNNSSSTSPLGDGSGGGIWNDGGTLTLQDSILTHDRASTGSGGAIWNDGTASVDATTFTSDSTINGGGAIHNTGNLTVTNSTFIGNSSGGNGGALDQFLAPSGAVMNLTNDIISDNTAGGEGGGVMMDSGTVTLSGGTIGGTGSTSPDDKGNSASGCGGGLAVEGGSLTSSGVTYGGSDATQGNTSSQCAGGIYLDGGTNSFSNDTISANSATAGNDGGGLEIDAGTNQFNGETIGGPASSDGNSVTFTGTVASQGAGAYIDGGTNIFTGGTVSNNVATESDGGAFYIDAGTNIFNGVSVNGNTATWSSQVNEPNGDGGGFFILAGTNTFTGGSISSNIAYEGAGVFVGVLSVGGPNNPSRPHASSTPHVSATSPNTFTQETIDGNMATEAGGGLALDSTFFSGITQPSANVTSSTISDNQVGGEVGITSFLGDGGGILANGCTSLTLTNDTITGNVANDGGGYAAVNCFATPPPGSTAFLFDTVNANTARNPSGAGNLETISGSSSTTTAAETIIAGGIAGGSAQNCLFGSGGTFTSGGYNLIDDSTCGTPAATDIIGQGAQLGALANNGGPTQTELPASTSPAVGAIPSAVCSGTGVSTDQRSDPRGTGKNGSCTIGAVEVALSTPPPFNPNGYRMVADEGGIFDFGLNFNGSLANNKLNAPIVGIANSPGVNGYLMAGGDGGVFALGGANFYGSLGGQTIPSPIAAIAAPPSESGYWLVAQNGKIYNYGSVPPLPALSLPPGAHIVGMASTTDGMGAWMTDQLGDVYAEGSAQYVGGLGGIHINKPIVGIAAAAGGQGYVLVATDGGVFAYGAQKFFGSVPGSLKPGQSLVAPIVGIAVTHSGNGYWEVGSDGGVFTYGDAPFLGSIYTAIGNHPLNGPIVGIQHLGVAPS